MWFSCFIKTLASCCCSLQSKTRCWLKELEKPVSEKLCRQFTVWVQVLQKTWSEPSCPVCVFVPGVVISRFGHRGRIPGSSGNSGKLKFISLTTHSDTPTWTSAPNSELMPITPNLMCSFKHRHTGREVLSRSEEAEILQQSCNKTPHCQISRKVSVQQLYMAAFFTIKKKNTDFGHCSNTSKDQFQQNMSY